MRVQDAETAMMQEQKDMTTAESAEGTTRKPKIKYEEMLNAIGDSLSDLSTSYDEENGEDKEDGEEDTVLGQLSNDEPGWVMGPISKKVQHLRESFRQKQMRLDELTQQGLGDAANFFRERDMKYGTAILNILAVINH